MRSLCLILAATALLSFPVEAGEQATKCLDADSGALFSTDEMIPFNGPAELRMPQVEYDPEGKPIKVMLTRAPAGMICRREQVGLHEGKAIWRMIFQSRAEVSSERFETLLFGYQATGPNGGAAIRPFFIVDGENLRSLESFFTSRKEKPFALAIHLTFQGNGVGWTTYSFQFTAEGARLGERCCGGRGMFAKTAFYDSSGNIVRTETATEN